MKQNLDTLKADIRSELTNRGLTVFHDSGRLDAETRYLRWDTKNYPDYKAFLDVAQQLGVKLMAFSHSELDADLIESAIDDLENLGFEYDEQKTYERKLRELSVYDGFICSIALSFDYKGICYLYEIDAEWYQELMNLLDELDLAEGLNTEGEDEDSFGGYYSKN